MQVSKHLPPTAHSFSADNKPQDFFADAYGDSDPSDGPNGDGSSGTCGDDGRQSAALASLQQDVSDGDGNSALKDIANAYANGDIDATQAEQMMSTLGSKVHENGGGKIDGKAVTYAQSVGLDTSTLDLGGHR